MTTGAELVVVYNTRPWMVRAGRKFDDDALRVLVINAGVYTGKTNYWTARALDVLLENPRVTTWWVAALDWQIGPFWDKFEPHARAFGARTRSSPYRRAIFGNGARLFCVSAKSIGTIASYHPDYLFVDEAAKISELAANLLMVRSLKARKAVFMSSANASAHWSKWVRWGREKKDGSWALETCTTEEAGILNPAEIARIRSSVPEDFARQELDAVILAGAGNVFKHVEQRAIGWPRAAGADRTGRPFIYLVTFDPAKQSDFGAVSVWRGHRQVRAYRWPETDYTVQARLVAAIAREYHNAMTVIDATGPGEAVYEMLRDEAAKGPEFDVVPFTFTAANKAPIVNEAVLAFQRGTIELVARERGEEYEACVMEHGAYMRTRSPAGLIWVYAAPEGEHDDFVSCTLLKMALEVQPSPMVLSHNRPEAGA